eukprot:4115661-Alexandrium_andersonii.AAC.1
MRCGLSDVAAWGITVRLGLLSVLGARKGDARGVTVRPGACASSRTCASCAACASWSATGAEA